MSSRKWTIKVLMKYILFQLPELALLIVALLLLQFWNILSQITVWAIIAIWIVKDAILFPFVWRSFDFGQHQDANPLIGQVGFTKEKLDPSGYISVRGELWKATISEEHPPIDKGKNVRILSCEGLTLVVEAITEQPGT